MTKSKIINLENSAYFATYRTCLGTTIFIDDNFVKIVLDCLQWLRTENRTYLLSFVIMPNHVHFIYQPKAPFIARQIAHSFGSFTAHQILRLLQIKNQAIVDQFKKRALYKKDRNTIIWENVYVKIIPNSEMLKEKMEYIHNNPINKNWRLCDERGLYPYSSACYYDYSKMPIIEIDPLETLYI
jgi:putative transposase